MGRKFKSLSGRLRAEQAEWSTDEPMNHLLGEAATRIEDLEMENADLKRQQAAVQEHFSVPDAPPEGL